MEKKQIHVEFDGNQKRNKNAISIFFCFLNLQFTEVQLNLIRIINLFDIFRKKNYFKI